MTLYLTATTDAAAFEALTAPRTDAETIESPLAADSDAFAFLIDLIRGEEDADGGVTDEIVVLDSAGSGDKVVKVATSLRDTVADLDEDVLQSLAEPWSSDSELQELDIDPVDFLTDFQHLCRNAVALEADVYAVERL